MNELPIDTSSWIDGVSCDECIFKSEPHDLSSGNMLCSEPPWQAITTNNSYCGHGISKKTGEKFQEMIICSILEKWSQQKKPS